MIADVGVGLAAGDGNQCIQCVLGLQPSCADFLGDDPPTRVAFLDCGGTASKVVDARDRIAAWAHEHTVHRTKRFRGEIKECLALWRMEKAGKHIHIAGLDPLQQVRPGVLDEFQRQARTHRDDLEEVDRQATDRPVPADQLVGWPTRRFDADAKDRVGREPSLFLSCQIDRQTQVVDSV